MRQDKNNNTPNLRNPEKNNQTNKVQKDTKANKHTKRLPEVKTVTSQQVEQRKGPQVSVLPPNQNSWANAVSSSLQPATTKVSFDSFNSFNLKYFKPFCVKFFVNLYLIFL